MRKVYRIFIAAALLTAFLVSCSDMINKYRTVDPGPLDCVFILDLSGSMTVNMNDVDGAFDIIVDELEAQGRDTQYAVVAFSRLINQPPELFLDWTADGETVKSAITANLASQGAIEDASLETIRIVLQGAVNNTLSDTQAGGNAVVTFRPVAEKKIILFTDEESDRAFYPENRFLPDQSTPDPPAPFPSDPANGWVREVENTAGLLSSERVSTVLFVDSNFLQTRPQLGDTTLQVQNSDASGFDAAATLQILTANGLADCLQARLLAAGSPCRMWDINELVNVEAVRNLVR